MALAKGAGGRIRPVGACVSAFERLCCLYGLAALPARAKRPFGAEAALRRSSRIPGQPARSRAADARRSAGQRNLVALVSFLTGLTRRDNIRMPGVSVVVK